MRVRRKFLKLTKYTCPHGNEVYYKNHLPNDVNEDQWGNYYYIIGDNPTSMFTCHMDTVGAKVIKVNHVQDDKIIKTDGKSILGADDKAGMLVLLYMIEQRIPGLYYFFLGEEVGCVGSKPVSRNWNTLEYSKNINKVVSFDRRGTSSIITHQLFERCCSNEFALDLADKLNDAGFNLKMIPDNTGVLTDSINFTSKVPECTNISVGYNNEHTSNESQNIDYLTRLCKSVCVIDWESITIARDKNSIESMDYYDYYYDGIPSRPTQKYDKDNWSRDYFSWFSIDGITKKMYISRKRIEVELDWIYKWIYSSADVELDEIPNSIMWDGHTLNLKYSGYSEYFGNRTDLVDYIPALGYVSIDELRENVN